MCPFHYITLFSVHQIWEGGTGEIKEYNDTLARLSVTNVKILSEEKMEVTLYGTVTLTVDM